VLHCLVPGADAVLIGRPVLHGHAVDGAAGVRHALRIPTEEPADAMALAGVLQARSRSAVSFVFPCRMHYCCAGFAWSGQLRLGGQLASSEHWSSRM
jgi:hypothetical protein